MAQHNISRIREYILICNAALTQAKVHAQHVTRHNTPIHNILSTASQVNISPKALGRFPENDNIMHKHVGSTIHN
jgi:hypothetical protein